MEVESLFPRESRVGRFLWTGSHSWSSNDEEESLTSFSREGSGEEDGRDMTSYVSDYKLMERILESLPLDALLLCRLVCRKWNDVIGHSGIIWPKGCLTLSRRQLVAHSLEGLIQSDLVVHFKCPNFQFSCLDLRSEGIHNFLMIQGPSIRHLSIVSCHMSKATFDFILLECPSLSHLEIHDLPRSVSMCRLLLPPQLKSRVNLVKLETLILKRLVDERSKGVPSETKKEVGMMDNFNGENLSVTFLEQLLESCTRMKRIELRDWEGPTLYNLMTVLNCRTQFTTLTDLTFLDMRVSAGGIDPQHFFPLCTQAVGHLRLRGLSVTLKDPIPRTKDNVDMDRFKELDTVFELTLDNQRESLECLSLNNVPVTREIFKGPFPRLTALSLVSTWVEDVEGLSLLMPLLHVVDYSPYNCQSSVSRLKEIGSFGRSSPLDVVCLTSFCVLLSILTFILLMTLFPAYAEYFLGLGLWTLVFLCLSDFSDSLSQLCPF